jgi:vancomycin resistance protein YoaR
VAKVVRRKKNRKVRAMGVFSLLGACVLLGGGGVLLVPFCTPEGLTFMGFPLPPQTCWAYREFLEKQAEQIARRSLQPFSPHLTRLPVAQTARGLGVELDVEGTYRRTPFESLLSRWLRRQPMAEPIRPVWRFVPKDFSSLNEFVVKYQLPPAPAKVFYEEGRLWVQKERTPVRLQTEKIPEVVVKALEEGQTAFELPLQREPPAVPDESLHQITGIISEFSTRFDPGNRNRTENLRLAVQSLNGILVLPGRRLSFNEAVGERSVGKGYKLATIFRQGKEALGIGGGVCQVSGTLFNAALLAGLRIVERQNHSKPVAYLPPGRDATVDFGSVDLVIENTKPFPIAILGEVRGGRLWIGIAGMPDPDLKVSVFSVLVSAWDPPTRYVLDASLPKGETRLLEEGRGGRRWVTWRVVKYGGSVISRERVAESVYPPLPRVVARGVGSKTEEGEPSLI